MYTEFLRMSKRIAVSSVAPGARSIVLDPTGFFVNSTTLISNANWNTRANANPKVHHGEGGLKTYEGRFGGPSLTGKRHIILIYHSSKFVHITHHPFVVYMYVFVLYECIMTGSYCIIRLPRSYHCNLYFSIYLWHTFVSTYRFLFCFFFLDADMVVLKPSYKLNEICIEFTFLVQCIKNCVIGGCWYERYRRFIFHIQTVLTRLFKKKMYKLCISKY